MTSTDTGECFLTILLLFVSRTLSLLCLRWGIAKDLPLWFWGLVATLSIVVSVGLVFLFYKVKIVLAELTKETMILAKSLNI